MDWIIRGGDFLGQGAPAGDALYIAQGRIAEAPAEGARMFDAGGLTVAPGLVDLHGDGFERSLSPRPGVYFDPDVALIDADRQMVCNGITTAWLALTISWEPGLRSVETARRLVEDWARLRPGFACDIRLQLRWEVYALDAVEQVEAWLALDPAPSLAFNDHFTGLFDPATRMARSLSKYAARAGLSVEAYREMIGALAERRAEVAPAIARLAAAAARAGVPMLAHDEGTAEARRAARAQGIAVSEFPLTRAAAEAAAAAGEAIVLGAPNVVRGGSHIGALDAGPAAEAGLCTALASDYYYPAPLAAAARLLEEGRMAPDAAWSLVSAGPAAAMGLADRGTLAPGARGDVVLLRRDGAAARIEAVFAAGRLVWCARGL
ncbi:alpha-D-ribose 1-methylphosphonate 5-triphosphate diphosphatase [Rhodovulum sp. DZ06]|uniref:alpha-D-ribose 1-methylphosphonate 5-triphosphate diphosphatase n=1 Tax=Rhodovulum sp. DZ06 TaxID=3425126 RepID=UPI003D354BE6